jgi:hypothetical protein
VVAWHRPTDFAKGMHHGIALLIPDCELRMPAPGHLQGVRIARIPSPGGGLMAVIAVIIVADVHTPSATRGGTDVAAIHRVDGTGVRIISVPIAFPSHVDAWLRSQKEWMLAAHPTVMHDAGHPRLLPIFVDENGAASIVDAAGDFNNPWLRT